MCGGIMAERPVIHIMGESSSLVYATIERLLRTNAHLVIEPLIIDGIKTTFSAELEFGHASVFSSTDVAPSSGHRVLLFGHASFEEAEGWSKQPELNGIELIHIHAAEQKRASLGWPDAEVIIHDMIPMRTQPFSLPASFTAWLPALGSGKEPSLSMSQDHWWIAEIDVADALVRLLMCDAPFPPFCSMSGRRAWSIQQTYEEFSLLYKRTMAGQSGVFGVEELTAAPAPHIELQPLVITDQPPMSIEENSSIRPDLSSVHDALHHADGDGWRPLVPIRTSLMHCLASMLDPSQFNV